MQIIRRSETYSLTDEGHIGRPAIGMEPSGSWQFLGIVPWHGFGPQWGKFISFRNLRDPDILASIEWFYKNGKPRYHGVDRDHGTQRIWGSPNDLLCIR
jgi:hypothetical protein